MTDTTPAPELVRQVARYFASWLEVRAGTLSIPGVQAAMLSGGEMVMSAAHGFADLESQAPLRTNSLFRVASHSKTFTATAVMQLLEQQKLRLDDPAGQWLPWLGTAAPALSAVTIRELLGHGGGVIRDGLDGDYWQLYRPFPGVDDLRALLGSEAATYSRNEHFKYSNIGYTLLGSVVEAASGQPYNAYVSEHVVARLGLANTGPEFDPARADEYASGYTSQVLGMPRRSIEHVDTSSMAAATGFYSTAEDLCRYAAGHFLGNDVLVTDDSKRLMQREEWQPEGNPGHYGLGFMVQKIGDRRVIGHGGGYPGHTTKTLFDPQDGVAVSVLTNTLGAPVSSLSEAAFKLLDLAGKESGVPADGGHDLDRFCGRFVNLWSVMDVVRFGSTLYALWPDQADPTETATKLEPAGDDALTITRTDGYHSHGETMRFAFDGDVAVKVRALSNGTMLRPEDYRRDLESVARIEVGRPWSTPPTAEEAPSAGHRTAPGGAA